MRVRALAVLLMALLGLREGAAAGPGRVNYPPLVQTYLPSAYRAGTQNFCVLQDARSVMNAGNFDGVLAFDGVGWRLVRLPGHQIVYSLAQGGDGRLYAGSQGEIGFLEQVPGGGTAYHSLAAQVPPGTPRYRNVVQTLATPAGMLFVAEEALLTWARGRVEVRTSSTGFQRAAVLRGTTWVLETGQGLWALDGGKGAPRVRQPLPAGAQLCGMLPWHWQGREELLLATRGHGLFHFDGATVRPFRTPVDGLLKGMTLTSAAVLPDGGLALGTRQDGALLLDRTGALTLRITRAQGLPTDRVLGLACDDQGGLWMALNRGLARVSLNPCLRAFHEGTGIEGPLSLCEGPGGVYAGTTRGLARLVQSGGTATFQPLPGPKDQVWTLRAAPEGLLAGTSEGVFAYRFRGGALAGQDRLSFEPVFAFAESRKEPGLLFAGTYHGLATLRREQGRWVFRTPPTGVTEDLKSLVEDPEGTLWAEAGVSGVLRIRPEGGWIRGRTFRVDRLGTEAGLPEARNNQVFLWRGAVHFATKRGIYAWNAAAGRAVPAPDFVGLFGKECRWTLSPVPDGAGGLWLISVDPESGLVEPGRAVPAGPGGFRWAPFPYPPLTNPNTSLFVQPTPGGSLWFGSPEDGLFWVDPGICAGAAGGFPVLLRGVARRDGPPFSQEPGATGVFEWTRTRGSVRFAYAAPRYERPEGTRYQVFLEGHDPGWSPWITESYRDYTNLPAGDYRLRVRARDFHGAPGRETAFPFRVRPPWYGKAWARAALLGLLLAAVLALVHLRHRTLVRRNRRLEEVVRAATREIEQDRSKLARLNAGKTRMMTILAHDIRNPLSAILCYSEQLAEEGKGTPWEDLGLRVHRATDLILNLVQRLLDPRLLQDEPVPLKLERLDLAEAATLAAAMLAARAREKGQRIAIDPGPGGVEVLADPVFLAEILDNLLGNALKFMPCGPPERTVRVRVQADGLILEDEGPGIPAAEAERVFEAFYRAGAKPTGGEASTGLGLFIVRKWMEAMGGRIRLESEPGRGARFHLTFRMPEPGPGGGEP